MEKPKSTTSEHHLLDNLLAHLPFLSNYTEKSVHNLKSITTYSTVVSTPNFVISTISTDIVHPSTSDSADVLNTSHLLKLSNTTSKDVSHPLNNNAQLEISTVVTSADDLVVVQSLLELREGSEQSDRLSCSHVKGEEKSENMQAISYSLAKMSEWSPTLVDYVSYEAEAFTHLVLAYQVLAEQENVAAERILNLVHTTASMQRANDAITAMPSTAGDDFEYAGEFFGDDGEDDEIEDMSIGGEAAIPSWMDVDTIKHEIGEIKKDFVARLDARLPGTTMTEIAQKLRKEADLNRKVEAMNTRLTNMEKSMAKILENQETQKSLLQQLVAAQTSTSTQLDANKKGEKDSIVPVSQGESKYEGEKVLNIQFSKSNDKWKKLDVAAAELELNEKWKKLDENIKKKFSPIEKQDKVFSHFSQLRQISANEMSLGNMERGQSSSIKSLKANEHPVSKSNDDKEEYIPIQSTTSSQPAIPTLKEVEFKVDPNITFHGEPVIPKDESIDWDSLPLPDLNILIQVKPRKTKKKAIKKAKPVKIQSKSPITPKLTKGDKEGKMASPHDTSMTWEGRRCGGFVTTQIQGQEDPSIPKTSQSFLRLPSSSHHFKEGYQTRPEPFVTPSRSGKFSTRYTVVVM
ncbi:hypothetical protein AgCh_005859 [Apium graveolens]